METCLHRQANPVDKPAYAASNKGWMNSEIFHKWFIKYFIPNIPNEHPALLIVDGHVSHISCDVI
ncbi:hypothetical protein NQ314_014510 [Rhamnusium bicolor]|uniref:DDE-1 domain-containing protein n=1 Tax=Rhamnusium bicolor TaxID=1586634 RepID=A0AAV8X2Q5_9CUCU|nr:hypothetical protein NQ314_014510 [Rhamnusium bicolor]